MKLTLTIALTVVSMAGLAFGWLEEELFGDEESPSLFKRESPPILTLPQGCDVNGKHYDEGEEFKMGPCTYCRCKGGHETCLATMMAPLPCVDPEDDGETCGGICPNGPNCAGPNGTVIGEGEEFPVREDGLRCTCTVSENRRFTGIQCLLPDVVLPPQP